MKYNTYWIIRDGADYMIHAKTYEKPKTENQLRHYAIRYMIDHDISTKYPFHIEYLNTEIWYAGKQLL